MSTLAAAFEREDAVPGDRHHRRLIQELAVRASVSLAVLVFDVFFDVTTSGGGNRIAPMTHRTGLVAAGGLAAAPYLGVYAIVPVYAGLVFSSRACLLATALAAVSYLAVALGTSRAPVAA